MTVSPTRLSTGTDSPVSADSSTEAVPDSTTPSVGIDSPVRTTSTSPACTCSAGISLSTPSRSTVARLGRRSSSALIASEVRPLARASKNLPSVINARIVPAPSKYRSWENWETVAMSPWPRPNAILYSA